MFKSVRQSVILSIAILIVALLVSGCNNSCSDSGTSEETGHRVYGTLTSPFASWLEGISCKLVSVGTSSNQRSWDAKTDENGVFSFDSIPDGKYELITVREGYYNSTTIFSVDGEDVNFNLALIADGQWGDVFGADHPYDSTQGIITSLIQFSANGTDTISNGGVSGIKVDLHSNSRDDNAYEDLGYNHADGYVDWDAESTSNTGMATFYNVDTGDTYTMTASRSNSSFETITDVTPKAGEITNYVVKGETATTGFSVKIINNSINYADKDVYVVICGHDADGKYYYLDFSTGKMTLVTDKPKDGTFYTTLDKIGSGADHTYTNPVDNLIGGRMYISMGKPADFHVNDNDATKWATPDFTGGDKYTIVDKVEFCCDSNGKFTTNTTCVDYFGIAFNLVLEKTDGTQYKSGFNITKNSEVTDPFANLDDTDVWKKCLIKDSKGNVMRILAPNKFPGTEADNPFKDYLTETISDGWTYYKANTMSASYDKWTYTGTVQDDGNLHVTCKNGDTVVGTESIPQPSSYVVFACDGYPLPNSGDDWSKKLHGLIGSALNRGVFVDDSWSPGSYYQSTTAKYNYYAKVLHDKALDNKCYAFAYDDFFKQDTTCDALYGDIQLVTVTIPEMPKPE